MVDETPQLTPESLTALADAVVENHVIPKRIPEADDIDGQTKAVGGALASALLTATEMPLTTLQPVVGALAAQLVALGIRQTALIDPAAVRAPGWMVNAVRQESIVVPEQPQHTEGEPFTARVAEAPAPPKTIRSHAKAVRL